MGCTANTISLQPAVISIPRGHKPNKDHNRHQLRLSQRFVPSRLSVGCAGFAADEFASDPENKFVLCVGWYVNSGWMVQMEPVFVCGSLRGSISSSGAQRHSDAVGESWTWS